MKVAKEKAELLLMEYAAGSLDEACALLVASYITVCPQARSYVRACEAYGGALMERDCSPVAMRRGSLEAVLSRLDEEFRQLEADIQENCGFCDSQRLPGPLAHHINRSAPQAKWRRTARGVEIFALPTPSCSYTTRLVKMTAGAKTPAHSHMGTEITLVLEGGFQDGCGHYRAGDLVVIEEQTAHRPVADEDGCLCLIATDAPVRFSGAFGRIFGLFYS